MATADLKTIKNEKYLVTVKSLRARNFSRNLPFLILSEKLPEGQIYREFPDGHIELQEVFISGSKYKSKVIQILKAHEANKVRTEYGLL